MSVVDAGLFRSQVETVSTWHDNIVRRLRQQLIDFQLVQNQLNAIERAKAPPSEKTAERKTVNGSALSTIRHCLRQAGLAPSCRIIAETGADTKTVIFRIWNAAELVSNPERTDKLAQLLQEQLQGRLLKCGLQRKNPSRSVPDEQASSYIVHVRKTT